MRESFDIRLIGGEASVLYIASAGAPLAPLALALLLTLVMFLLRDAYHYPAAGTAREAATDAIAGAAFILLLETFILMVAPALALPTVVMVRGTVLGMAMVSGWRMGFRVKTPEDPRRQQLEDVYNETWQINILFMIAGIVLIAGNLSAVPATRDGRDFLLTCLPIAAFGLAYGLRAKREIPLGKDVPYASLGLRHKPLQRRTATETSQPLRKIGIIGFVWDSNSRGSLLLLHCRF